VNFSKTDACRILSTFDLAPRTAQIAQHWLSLWDGDRCPGRASILPANIKTLLPGLILFRVTPNRSVTVRMAGTSFYPMLQLELTGKDWLAHTPDADRHTRLAVFSDVANGAIAVGRWIFHPGTLREVRCEKLLLPLSPAPGDDGIPVLGFVDWMGGAGSHDVDLKQIPLPRILGEFSTAVSGNAREEGR